MAKRKTKSKKKKKARIVPTGIAYIKSTFNNTLVSITDNEGNVLAWSSAGSIGNKGARKGTSFAAQEAAKDVVNKTKPFRLKTVHVKINGPGPGRDSALRGLHDAGLNIKSIEDITPIPHNGCRPRKQRRV